MKIGGLPLVQKNLAKVTLYRGEESYTLTLCPLPSGWMATCNSRGLLNYPKPPKKAIRDTDDATGRRTNKVIEDRNDAEYKKALSDVNRKYEAVTLAEHLKEDGSVSFEVVRPDTDDAAAWDEYAAALVTELTDSDTGFTDAEMAKLLEIGEKLECRIDLDKAVDHFLSTSP